MQSKQGSKQAGKRYEDLCCKYLLTCGYKIITRNWYCKTSEIDIIARDKEELVFIEVKGRSQELLESFEDTMSYKKRSALYKGVLTFFQARADLNTAPWRFDFMGVTQDSLGRHRLHYYKNISLFLL